MNSNVYFPTNCVGPYPSPTQKKAKCQNVTPCICTAISAVPVRVDVDALDQSGEVCFIATFGVKLSIWFQVSGGTPRIQMCVRS